MNRDYARTIPLRAILEKIGPDISLHVDHQRNTWRDPATGTSGGVIELVQAWLLHQGRPCTEDDALHWLRFNIGYPALVDLFGLSEGAQRGDYELLSKSALQERSLIRYALRQGMTHERARRVFKQIQVRNLASGKVFRALGMRTEDDGYAMYSPHVTDIIAPRAVSVIRGRLHKPESVHVFLTIFDHCVAIRSIGNIPFDQDSIILHAYDCADDAATYIRYYGYKQLYSWFDGSERGRRATEAFHWLCATEPDLEHRIMNIEL